MSDSHGAGFPLSPQQKHLWSLAADGSIFNAVISVSLQGSLDSARLKQAVQAVVARHEILRTTFERQAGMTSALQVVHEDGTPSWTYVDLRALAEDRQKGQCEEIFEAEARHPFDLSKGPILRAHLLALAGDMHMLVIALPSLCADAASLNNLVDKVAQAYSSPNSLEDVFQYADYAGFVNELVGDETDPEVKSGKQFWEDVLSETAPELQLPLQSRTGETEVFHAGRIGVQIPGNIVPASDADNVFATCWHLLLSRLSGQNRIVLNRISDGRNHDELQGAVGLFTRSLPLAYEFDSAKSFAATKRDLQTAWSSACERQEYFTDQRGALELVASFSSEKISTAPSGGALSWSIVRVQAIGQPFRVQLSVLRSDVTRLELRYHSGHFSRETAEQIAQRFAVLATSAIKNPELPIGELQIMSEAERRQVLIGFNDTAADFPRSKCIHQLIEETAARLPDRPALRFGETCLSYAELNQRANQIAHLLRHKGVKPGVAVPLCLDRSAQMIIALLGILKAGGAYVPLVPDNPKARLAQQLSDSQSPVLISEQKFVANLPAFAGDILCLDRDAALFTHESHDNPEPLNRPSDTVYVIYTSGSTGIPKGVAVSHSNLVNYAWFISQKLNPSGEPLNFATVSTLAADLGNTAIFPALISGGCLHVIGYEDAMAAERFASYLQRHPVDVLKITPSHLGSLLSAAREANVLPRKYLVLGGEAASWDLVRRVQQANTCKVINHYGPTEATVGCCTFAVSGNDVSTWSPATVPIGRPIANAQAYIVDTRMQPVPAGVPGELCIGGAGIANGYLNQPQQTAERFITNPFSNAPGDRLYRTGDLARFLPDGNIEFLGRIDQQVKIRGFRVEPAEIESVLRKNAAVQQAIVVPSDDNGDKRLIAYVVPANKSSQLASELRGHLQERLPDYMVPAAIVCLDSLPLTRNGKLDTAALPSADTVVVQHAMIAPRNAVEQGLADIWRQVLRVEHVGVEDNFFDLGGHSLLATQVIARIRSTFHVQLPLRSLFDSPTVAGLAQQIAALPQNSEDDEVARLLQELEGISDEEAERLLGQEMRNAAESSGND